ncbi:transposase, partial [Colwellia sp. D2M02]
MTKKKRPTYSAEFRLETAQLVIDEGYTQADAA